MIAREQLKSLVRSFENDAKLLFTRSHFHGAHYLSGYAVEIALKYRICHTLNWDGYPESSREFKGLQSFKTHNLNMLLRLSGYDDSVRQKRQNEWSIVIKWNTEARCRIQGVSESDVKDTLRAVTSIVALLVKS